MWVRYFIGRRRVDGRRAAAGKVCQWKRGHEPLHGRKWVQEELGGPDTERGEQYTRGRGGSKEGVHAGKEGGREKRGEDSSSHRGGSER